MDFIITLVRLPISLIAASAVMLFYLAILSLETIALIISLPIASIFVSRSKIKESWISTYPNSLKPAIQKMKSLWWWAILQDHSDIEETDEIDLSLIRGHINQIITIIRIPMAVLSTITIIAFFIVLLLRETIVLMIFFPFVTLFFASTASNTSWMNNYPNSLELAETTIKKLWFWAISLDDNIPTQMPKGISAILFRIPILTLIYPTIISVHFVFFIVESAAVIILLPIASIFMSRKNIKDSWINKYPVSLRTIGAKIRILWQWSTMNIEQKEHILSNTEKKVDGIMKILSFSTLVTILLYISYIAISFINPQISNTIKKHIYAVTFGDHIGGISAYKEGNYERAIKKLSPLANVENNPEIQFYLGASLIGTKKQQHIDEGINWLNLSAQSQNKEAAKLLIKLYFFEQELGITPNYEEAFALIADSGDVKAQMALARIFYLGYKNIESHEQTAIKWYRQAASNRDENAIWMLSFLTKDNNVIIKNVSDSNITISTGNSSFLADQYYSGFLVNSDNQVAFELYKKAVEKEGHILSRFRLAKMYYLGIGTSTNNQEAKKLFDQLENLVKNEKYDWAKYALGRMYYEGIAVSSSKDKAFELISAANLGTASASYMYFCFDLIVDGKFTDAMMPCRKAYELEPNVSNAINLGHAFLLNGNNDEATKHYEKARVLVSIESEVWLVPIVHDFQFFIKKGWKVAESQIQISLLLNEWKQKKKETDWVSLLLKDL
jgi:TPR repeat protein